MQQEQWTVQGLREFEESIRAAYDGGKIRGALHLSRGNESQLIEIFKDVKPTDWVFSAWRNHYHALLHGIPADLVRHEIMMGRSISLTNVKHRFFTSSIVGGILPIALGVALALSRDPDNRTVVWCFVGDMTASCGMFTDCEQYAHNLNLPIAFIIEDNGHSTNTPTVEAWHGDNGFIESEHVRHYSYKREWPHSGFKL